MIAKHAGILVVDPTPMVRKRLASVLAAAGLPKVTGLDSPRAALELLETKPCHLVFSEWYFESESGLEFLKKTRAHPFPRIRNLCFVVVSADARRTSVDEAMKAGADDYIVKPLSETQIQSRIFALLMKVAADQ